MPTLNLPHQNRLCIGTKPVFSFWMNISTVSEVRCDCQGLGLVARIEASILVFDTIQVLYWPILGQIQFCSFERICKTCLDTKPVLYQGRFCSLTDVTLKSFYPIYILIVTTIATKKRKCSTTKPTLWFNQTYKNMIYNHFHWFAWFNSLTQDNSSLMIQSIYIFCITTHLIHYAVAFWV